MWKSTLKGSSQTTRRWRNGTNTRLKLGKSRGFAPGSPPSPLILYLAERTPAGYLVAGERLGDARLVPCSTVHSKGHPFTGESARSRSVMPWPSKNDCFANAQSADSSAEIEARCIGLCPVQILDTCWREGPWSRRGQIVDLQVSRCRTRKSDPRSGK